MKENLDYLYQSYVLKNTLPINIEEYRKYLSDPQEIMAFAWQIVYQLKRQGYLNSNILKILKNKGDLKNNIFNSYHIVFNDKSKVLKRLYKYMYQYLDEEI